MDINEFEEILLKSASPIMRKAGVEIFKKGLVSKIKGKKIENAYHIYGEVQDNISCRIFTAHISIDLSRKKIQKVSCFCEDFKELSKENSLFMCKHLTATAYKFLSCLKEKEKVKHGTNMQEKKKAEMLLDVKLIHTSYYDKSTFEAEFRIGSDFMHLINDLKGFIKALYRKEKIYIDNIFTYDPKEHMISEDSLGLIKEIKKLLGKSRPESKRTLVIDPDDLREFLACTLHRKITFKYNGIEYKTMVLNKELPLYFTLKEKENFFLLTTHKKLPLPLNTSKDVYFFNDTLYLPSDKQIKKYLPLYDKFLLKGQVKFHETIENFNNIISLLSSISKNITLTEEVKNFAKGSLNYKFLIHKVNEDILCHIFAVYFNEKINILEDHKSLELLRDSYKEEKILMKLQNYRFIKNGSTLIFKGNDNDLFNLINNRDNVLNSLGNITFGEGLETLRILNLSSTNINLYEENDFYNLEYNIEGTDYEELPSIFESYKSHNRFYKTKDNGFLDFEDEGVINFLNSLMILEGEENIDSNEIKIPKNKAFYVEEILNNKNFKSIKGIELIDKIKREFSEISKCNESLPKGFKAKLRDYQIKGYKWLKALSKLELGGILADEMGLGKTIQIITLLLSDKKKKALIITPTSLLYNWKEEIERFAPGIKIGISHGNREKQQRVLESLKSLNVIITTYGTVRNNTDLYKDKNFHFLIIDEGQNIKNHAAEVTKAVKMINSKVRFALTGTPIENNLGELWSIFDFLMPGYLFSKEVFNKKFNEEENLEDLRILIKPFILRRTKKEVISELPDKIEHTVLVNMTALQGTFYKSYVSKIKLNIKNSKNSANMLSYLTKLRQICLDPSLIFPHYKGGSGKLHTAISFIEENIDNGGKTLLFSQFTSVLKNIGHALEEKNIEFLTLDGTTPPKERIRLVNEFNENSKFKVFLISLKAGGTGLNLTSANLVIHYDPWWNPKAEEQAADRAHRIGQKNSVYVIKLVNKGTIEEKIISLQEHKKELIDNVITGELTDSNINKLSEHELMKLFSSL